MASQIRFPRMPKMKISLPKIPKIKRVSLSKLYKGLTRPRKLGIKYKI